MENNAYNELRLLARQRFSLIWQKIKDELPLDDEEQKLKEIIMQHKEYHSVFDSEQTLRDAEITEEGVNPFLHITFHQIVEEQIAMKDPPEVSEYIDSAVRKGMERHEAVHSVARILSEFIFDVLKKKKDFDNEAYVKKIKAL